MPYDWITTKSCDNIFCDIPLELTLYLDSVVVFTMLAIIAKYEIVSVVFE